MWHVLYTNRRPHRVMTSRNDWVYAARQFRRPTCATYKRVGRSRFPKQPGFFWGFETARPLRQIENRDHASPATHSFGGWPPKMSARMTVPAGSGFLTPKNVSARAASISIMTGSISLQRMRCCAACSRFISGGRHSNGGSISANSANPVMAEQFPHPDIDFNLAHTRGLVAAAIVSRAHIGVDVEKIDSTKADFKVAENYFAAPEIEILRAASASERAICFFRFWTLKEAYLKAIGTGLERHSIRLPLPSRRSASISCGTPATDNPAALAIRVLADEPANMFYRSRWLGESGERISHCAALGRPARTVATRITWWAADQQSRPQSGTELRRPLQQESLPSPLLVIVNAGPIGNAQGIPVNGMAVKAKEVAQERDQVPCRDRRRYYR